MQEPKRGLRALMTALQDPNSAEYQTFRAFMDLLDEYKLTEDEKDLLLSRDMETIRKEFGFPSPVQIIGWWHHHK